MWYNLKCSKCTKEFHLNYNFYEREFDRPNLPGVAFYGSDMFSVACPYCGKRSRYRITDQGIRRDTTS